MNDGDQRQIRKDRLDAVERLQRCEVRTLMFRGDEIVESLDAVQAVLPGAFNPLHRGHREMARVAEQWLGVPPVFELSIENVDKASLGTQSIVERLTQFDKQQTICLTRAATFVQKAQLFDNAHFVVGADTILRIADARYYGGNQTQRDAAIVQLADRGARFLVFGRAISDRFHTLTRLKLPERLRAICREVREEDFRFDISSTDIRRPNSTDDG